MKPATQMLRALIETDAPKAKASGRKRFGGPLAAQRMEMAEIERLLGPNAWPWFGPMLILDCETTTDVGQKLRFGVFQERGLNYRNLVERKRLNGGITREDMDEQRSEGIFYNPATCSEIEIETMRVHAEKHGLRFLTLEKFLYTVFYRLYYYKRWREGDPPLTMPMLVIGHNLPFDLGARSVMTPGRAKDAITGASHSSSLKKGLPSSSRNWASESICSARIIIGTSVATFNLSIPSN
jgi:hypothetical protein